MRVEKILKDDLLMKKNRSLVRANAISRLQLQSDESTYNNSDEG